MKAFFLEIGDLRTSLNFDHNLAGGLSSTLVFVLLAEQLASGNETTIELKAREGSSLYDDNQTSI